MSLTSFVFNSIFLDLTSTRDLSNYATKTQIRLCKFKLRRKMKLLIKYFAFNKKTLHEKFIRNNYKFSASAGFFNVLILVLGITVLTKSEILGVKFLFNSPAADSGSSISSMLILCTQSCLSYKCVKWYIQLVCLVEPLLWLLHMIWLFHSSLTEFISCLMIVTKQ